ncbi:MAG: YbaB/EbfC family nucleoid-associated protein [Planctomycetota bacterium]
MDKDVVDPEDIEMLQDLIIAAVADAKRKTAQAGQDQVSSLTGGIDLSSLGINL